MYKSLIIFILIFALTFNFVFMPKKIYADFVIAPLATKIIITVLAGMGILNTIKNLDSIDNFIDGFKSWYETTTGITTFFRDLSLNGVSSIWSGTKTRVSALVESLSIYYKEIWKSDIEVGVPSDFYTINHVQFSGSSKDFPYDLNGITYLDSINITGTDDYLGYHWVITPIIRGNTAYRTLTNGFDVKAYYNNSLYYDNYSAGSSINWHYNTSSSYKYQFVFDWFLSDSGLITYHSIFSILDNTLTIIKDNTVNIFDNNLHNYLIGQEFVSKKSITWYPDELSIPWEHVTDIQIGATVDTVTENLVNADNDNLILYLEEIKEKINAKEPTKVIVDNDIVTEVIEGQIGEIIDGQETQTGFLSNIWYKIKDLTFPDYTLTDSIELDFSPLLDLGLTDKFPFSLPWDIMRLIEPFDVEGQAPSWEVPIVTETFVIDFSIFSSWASIVSNFTLLLYVIGLVLITRNIIGG